MMDPRSDSAFYEAFFTSPQSGASVSQQTFSSDVPPQPQLLQQQTIAMPSTNIITCRLCQQIFQEPVIFPCGHTFCLTCSNEWRKRQRVCPQAGCEKPLGEAVPNLLVKEAVISHDTLKVMEATRQQELALQLVAALQHQQQQQQFFAAAGGMVNHPPPMTPCEANGLYDDDIELQGQQWIGARKVDGRESRRSFQTHRNRDSERDWVSLEQTCTGGHQENMPPIEESPNKSPPLRPKESKQQHPSTPRCTRNKAFMRGTGERRTEIHQIPRKPVFSARRSLKAMLSGRPKETVPGRSTEDFALAVRMKLQGGNGFWVGDEQQDRSQESSDLASHPMNKLMPAKKDKSLWSKTKHLFSSNKAKK